MGMVPPKYLLPSAPYGQSDAINAVNAVQPQATNPQTPLLPPNFSDQGATVTGGNQTSSNPFQQRYPGMGGLMNSYRKMYDF